MGSCWFLFFFFFSSFFLRCAEYKLGRDSSKETETQRDFAFTFVLYRAGDTGPLAATRALPRTERLLHPSSSTSTTIISYFLPPSIPNTIYQAITLYSQFLSTS
ncbi:hypothetical protein QCA50_014445 [Cerrena zonata]|uniref:Secreted protein n=1 Tax=Cerrena zonata TaxID=2478898 RepID=A0AAW0G0U1_9APHY